MAMYYWEGLATGYMAIYYQEALPGLYFMTISYSYSEITTWQSVYSYNICAIKRGVEPFSMLDTYLSVC